MSEKMKIETIPIEKLSPAIYNPRIDLKPGDPDYEKLKKSIEEFDMVEPIVVNKMNGSYRIVGGHQRFKILKARGDKEVEASVVELNETKEKALNIALNKISGDWDMPMLKDLLEELDQGQLEDIEITGFDEGEIENLLTQFNPISEDEVPRLDEKSKVKCPECGCEFTP